MLGAAEPCKQRQEVEFSLDTAGWSGGRDVAIDSPDRAMVMVVVMICEKVLIQLVGGDTISGGQDKLEKNEER